MALIDQNKFYKDLESHQISPVYFIFGDEPFLIDQCVHRFKFALLDENSVDFNFNLFYAGECQIDTVKQSIETWPVFAEKRLVILKNAQNLKDSDWNELSPLFKNPVSSTVFVLFADKIDKRKKNFKNLMDTSTAIEFKKPYDNEVPRWINYFAQEYGLKLTAAATQRMHRLVGNNLTELYSQFEKLKNYMNEESLVDVEQINQVVSNSKEESVFDFTKAIGQRNKLKALEQISTLLEQGQSEIGVVSLLSRHMRILYTVRAGLDQGLGGTKLANLANISPYFIEDYCEQANQWTTRKIEDSLVLLHDTDRALKSSPLSSHLWLENMVIKACTL